MRVFVVGTGRCGSVTFAKACKHIQNYTSGHESNTHGRGGITLDYPDDHIEVDPRLSYWVPTLKKKYPDAKLFHLQRDEKPCIQSLSKRTSLHWFAKFHFGKEDSLKNIAEYYYHNIINMLSDDSDIISLQLENLIKEDWLKFITLINGKYNDQSIAILAKKHNKS